MSVIKVLLFSGLLMFGLGGCESKPNSTSVQKVHWDRDMCEQCKMVVSDRHHAVQVIDPKTYKVMMFDDIGCAVLWFQEENIAWKEKAIIWITDAKTGQWIDARKAYYDLGNITPMAFGFAPHKHKEDIQKDRKIFTFKQLSEQIIQQEEMKNRTISNGGEN